MGILLGWGLLFPQKKPVPPAAPAPAGAPAATTAAAPAELAAASPAAAAPAVAPVVLEAIAGQQEEQVVLESPGARATFSSRGAQLVSYKVLEPANRGGGEIELVRARNVNLYPFGLVDRVGAALPLNEALFAVDREADGGVVFRYRGEAGDAEKRFRFTPQGLIDLGITVRGRSGWEVFLGPGVGNPSAEDLQSQYGARSALYEVGDSVERVDAKGAKELAEASAIGLSWAGLDDNYYLAAVLPQEGVERLVLQPYLVQADAKAAPVMAPVPADGKVAEGQAKLPREYALRLVARGETINGQSYWGGKQYDVLAALPGGLEGAVSLGFFGWLARPLMIGLDWIYENVVANYGWAIVLMTVLIKILLLPLTHKTMVSMTRMQELAPKVEAIRARYATKLRDKQGRPNLEAQNQLNQEVMGLYRTEGVNPAGGCIPLLLQMPVFFAFFKLLSVSFELHKAPWILWVKDLSVYDPFYTLPLIMGATQFVQTWMTPSAGNPMQRRIFLMLPIVFTFLFLRAPSGLVIYWLTNNVLSIFQQAFYNRWKARRVTPGGDIEVTPVASKSRPRGKKAQG
jgi:YidC/Oxa1 family membrane protein insertase